LVRINRGNTVSELKKLSKARDPHGFRDISANCLQLWKWNQPGDADRFKAVELDSSNVLNPMKKITSIFKG